MLFSARVSANDDKFMESKYAVIFGVYHPLSEDDGNRQPGDNDTTRIDDMIMKIFNFSLKERFIICYDTVLLY